VTFGEYRNIVINISLKGISIHYFRLKSINKLKIIQRQSSMKNDLDLIQDAD